MRSFTRRTALASGAALASTAALAACGGKDSENADLQDSIDNLDDNINAEGMPIVNEKVTIKFLSARPATTAENWDEVSAVRATEEITNVKIDFGLIPQDGAGERRNLLLTSGDYPEAFFRTGVPTGDIAKYGARGTFVPLNDLIEKYMPNFKQRLEDMPDIRNALTFPDGNIYSLPQIYDASFTGMRYMFKLWARQDWLDEAGMDAPETIDEFEAYLEEAVNNHDGAIGLADAAQFGEMWTTFYGTFGVGNHGSAAGLIDLDPDTGKVRYFPASDQFREMMEYLNRLYSKGLILQDIFSSDRAKFNTYGADGRLAACSTQTPAGFFGEVGENYVPLKPLVKNAGDEPVWHAARAECASIGHFVMTDKCEHPVELARWMDWWYSEEGAPLFFMGAEGEGWERNGDEYELKPEITEGGKTLDDGLKQHALFLGGSYPGWVTEKWFKGVEGSEQSLKGSELVAQYAIEDVWNPFTLSEEEADRLSVVGAEIGQFLDESRAGFVTGQKPLSEWDDYVATLDKIGLPEFLEIQQAAYDRRG